MGGELTRALNAITDHERRLDNQERFPHLYVACPACAELKSATGCRYCGGTRKASRAFARDWFAQVGLLRTSEGP